MSTLPLTQESGVVTETERTSVIFACKSTLTADTGNAWLDEANNNATKEA